MTQIYCQIKGPTSTFEMGGISIASAVSTSVPFSLTYSVPHGSAIATPAEDFFPSDLYAIRVTRATDPTPNGEIDITAESYVLITIAGLASLYATEALSSQGKTLGVGKDCLMLVPEGDVFTLDAILMTSPWDTTDKLWAAMARVLRNRIEDFQQS
jgi:hypothetical protein